jgi:hypothetical protein
MYLEALVLVPDAFESFCPTSGTHLCVIFPWQHLLQLAHEHGTDQVPVGHLVVRLSALGVSTAS